MKPPVIRRVELGGEESGIGRVQLPGTIPVRGLESIRVAMDGEARSNGTGGWESECTVCGKKLYEDGHGRMVDSVGGSVCRKAIDDGTDHVAKDVPLTWLNSFGVSLNEEEDSITLHVSVGDPRGAMVMTLRKVDGGIWLHVPHAGESHVELEPIGDGAFRIK